MSGDLSETFGVPGGEAPAIATAGWVSRAGAALVDFFVRLAIVLGAAAIGAVGYAAGSDVGEVTVNIGTAIGLIAALAYAPIMLARTGGQTVGHKASGTRIVMRDGSRMNGGRAALREVVVKNVLFEGVAVLLAFVPTLLNYLWPLWDSSDEALHDKLCATRVVEA